MDFIFGRYSLIFTPVCLPFSLFLRLWQVHGYFF